MGWHNWRGRAAANQKIQDKIDLNRQRTTKWSLQDRLDFFSMPEPNSGCVLWLGSYQKYGHGHSSWKGRHQAAHRLAWIAAYGPIPVGQNVIHKCDVPSCINPKHLRLGTQRDNMNDKAAKGRAGKKLTAAQAAAIRDDKRPLKTIAAEYGISRTMADRIRNGRSWGLALANEVAGKP